MSPPGRRMAAEIEEQPGVLERVLADGLAPARAVAAAVARAAPRFVVLAGRGTSDHAALYAKYLVEVLLGLPAGLASASATTVYGARPDLRGVLYVAVSQSGRSPDMVEALMAAGEGGAITVAVTNDAGSPLARVAAHALDVRAGSERAVAATKTYTAELLTLYLLVDALRAGSAEAARRVPAAAAEALSGPSIEPSRYAAAERMVVTARGYGYATAREAALKLMETSYLAAFAFSGADLLHGPVAMLEPGSQVIALVPDGPGGRAMAPVLERLSELGAEVEIAPPVPVGVAEELAPVIQVIPFQRLALKLALLRGLDPDRPRSLSKVTATR